MNPVPNNTLTIRYDECLLFLPKQAVEIQVKQSDLVIVKPQASIKLVINQGKLRIAEKGEKYKYEVNATRSNVDDFVSHKDASISISIKAKETNIKVYEFNK